MMEPTKRKLVIDKNPERSVMVRNRKTLIHSLYIKLEIEKNEWHIFRVM